MRIAFLHAPRGGSGLGLSAVLLLGSGRVLAEETASPWVSDGSSLAYLVELVIGLIVVIGAIVAAAWLLKRVNRFTTAMGGEMRILGGLSMGPRERLVLVEVGKQQLLLGVAPGRVQMLHVLEYPIDVDAVSGSQSSFPQRLATVMRREQGR